MRQRFVRAAISPRQALLCLLTLGQIVGCGTAPEETTAARAPEVRSVKQAFEQMLNTPFPPATDGPAQACEVDALREVRAELLVPSESAVDLTCSLTLQPSERIQRPLKLRGSASGVIIDCQDQLRTNRDGNGNLLAPSIGRASGDEIIGIRSD